MNTDKAEALARQDGTFQTDKSEGVTTGVRDGDTQGQDARLIANEPVQNDGTDDIETETDDLGEGNDEVIDPLDE